MLTYNPCNLYRSEKAIKNQARDEPVAIHHLVTRVFRREKSLGSVVVYVREYIPARHHERLLGIDQAGCVLACLLVLQVRGVPG